MEKKIHDPTAVPLECPFQAALTIAHGPDGQKVPTFVRAPCGAYCAGYDRAGQRSCFEAARAHGEVPKVPLRPAALPDFGPLPRGKLMDGGRGT